MVSISPEEKQKTKGNLDNPMGKIDTSINIKWVFESLKYLSF